jgi:solute carrier family 25 carnitine/acylcarnitine transporter 20/29
MEEALEPTALSLAESTADFIAGKRRASDTSRSFFLTSTAPLHSTGGVGGMSGVVAGAPLDFVRIRQQQPGAASHGSVLGVLRRAFLTEGGARAWFRGSGMPLSSAALQNALCFHSYGHASRALQSADSAAPLSLPRVFMAGCVGGAVQTAVITPVDLIKIRLQLQTARPGAPGYVGPLGQARRVLAGGGGLAALYRGTAITLIRDIPSHGVYFAAFEWAREALEPGCRGAGRASESAAAVWAAGGIAGAVSWITVYPFDVIKSRIQASGPGTYASWMDCAVKSWRAEGPHVFVRGLNATLARAFIVNGAIFSAYEASHSALRGR